MTRKLLILLICSIFCVNCSSKVDQKKFEKLYRAAKSIEGAVTIGVDYQKFGELLQNFVTEISIASDKAKSEEEKELLKIYSEILDMYQDSYRLWHSKNSLSCELFFPGTCPVPRGYIHVGEGDTIIKKYNFSAYENTKVTGDFNRYYIPEDSIQVIWSKAHERLEKANILYLGN